MALVEVCQRGDLAAVRVLLPGVNLNSYSSYRLTPLHAALFSRNLELVQLLLDSGADPNALTKAYGRPLHVAAMIRSPGASQLLLNHGADPNAASNDGTLFSAS